MRFRVLMSLLAFVLCLLPSHAKAAEQLQTAWIGEHEAFLVWYAKQKGWDKDAGLDIRMLRFGSGDKIVSRQGDYQWKIAGCGAVPTLMAASKGQFYVVGIGNDESDLNAIYVRPDSPILKAKGANPRYPDVYGSADTVRGKLILVPGKTSAHYLLSTWLHILGLKDEDVKIQNVLPGPAVDMFSKGFGDAVSIWLPPPTRRLKRAIRLPPAPRTAASASLFFCWPTASSPTRTLNRCGLSCASTSASSTPCTAKASMRSCRNISASIRHGTKS